MCNRPIETIVTNGTRQKYIKYPCGQCLGCRLDKQKQWSERCKYELKKHVKGAFVTITYDDLHLEFKEGCKRPTLSREQFDKYIDRVTQASKEKYGKDFRYKFFASNEYGGKLLRPHAHILFFGLDWATDQDVIKKTWKLGMTKILPVKISGIRYVVDYFSKEHVNGQLAIDRYDSQGLERPFISHSQGLGRGLYFEHREEILKTGKIMNGTKSILIPPYYKSLLSDYSDENTYAQTNSIQKNEKRMKQRAKNAGYDNVKEYEEDLKKGSELNLLARLRNKGAIIDDREIY